MRCFNICADSETNDVWRMTLRKATHISQIPQPVEAFLCYKCIQKTSLPFLALTRRQIVNIVFAALSSIPCQCHRQNPSGYLERISRTSSVKVLPAEYVGAIGIERWRYAYRSALKNVVNEAIRLLARLRIRPGTTVMTGRTGVPPTENLNRSWLASKWHMSPPKSERYVLHHWQQKSGAYQSARPFAIYKVPCNTRNDDMFRIRAGIFEWYCVLNLLPGSPTTLRMPA